jgi:hypothetical protein
LPDKARVTISPGPSFKKRGKKSPPLEKKGEGGFIVHQALDSAVFDDEPFGHELPSGLSLRVEDKAEGLRRNEFIEVKSEWVC